MDINYNTNFLCTYKSFPDNYYSNLCYQIQLLQAFNMKFYDEKALSKAIYNCYKSFSNDKTINEILDLITIKYSKDHSLNQLLEKQNDKSIQFQMLFSFTYFDDFHKCLIELNKIRADPSSTINQYLFEKIKLSLKKD